MTTIGMLTHPVDATISPSRGPHEEVQKITLSHTRIAQILITAGSRIRSILKHFQDEASGEVKMEMERIDFYRNGMMWEIEVNKNDDGLCLL
jgi:hypothetical protein